MGLVIAAVVALPGGSSPGGGVPVTVTPPPGGSGASVAVDAGATTSGVSPDLIGANVTWNTGDQLADVGTDGRTDARVAAFLRANHDLRILAFPGGEMSNCYDWRQGVGPQAQRGDQQGWDFNAGGGCHDAQAVSHFGTPEFMSALAAAAPNAKAVMIVNVCSTAPGRHCGTSTGTTLCPAPPSDCPGATTMGADWVQYLNGDSHDPSKPWAQLRARSGHPAPYGVHYFQLGNELYNDSSISPAGHAAVVSAYVAAMKAEDASISVGATLDDSGKRTGWNEDLAKDPGLDFLVPHLYGPNFSDSMSSLRPGAVERWQAWGFDTRSAGPAEVDVDAAQWSSSGQAHLDVVVDGNPAMSVRGAALTPYKVTGTALSIGALPAGHHRLLVGLPAGAQMVRVMGAQACTPSCGGGPATPIDVAMSAHDPDAIRPLVARADSATFATGVSAPAASTLTVSGFGMAAAAPCPSATVTVDGALRGTLGTGSGGAAPCHDPLAPARLSVPLAAGSHNLVVSSAGGEVDISSVAVAAPGAAPVPVDLTLNPGGLGAVAVADAISATHGYDYWLGQARKTGKPLLVTEWNIWTDYTTVAFAGFEDVRAVLFEALALQEFERSGVAGAALWSMDNGDGFRLIHCDPGSAHDEPATCLSHGRTPTNALPGWLFSMLRGAIDPSLLSTTIASPQLTAQPILDGDGTTASGGGQVLTQLQATATRSASTVHVLLVNVGTSALDVAVAIGRASIAGRPALTTLTGPLDAVDGCRRTPLDQPVGCDAAPVTPSAPQPQAVTGSSVSLHLPAGSVSVLTVPITG